MAKLRKPKIKKTRNYQFTFKGDKELLEIMSALRTLLKTSTRSKLIQTAIIILCVDIAGLDPDPNWTTEQKHAWVYCKNISRELKELFSLRIARGMLEEENERTNS